MIFPITFTHIFRLLHRLTCWHLNSNYHSIKYKIFIRVIWFHGIYFKTLYHENIVLYTINTHLLHNSTYETCGCHMVNERIRALDLMLCLTFTKDNANGLRGGFVVASHCLCFVSFVIGIFWFSNAIPLHQFIYM